PCHRLAGRAGRPDAYHVSLRDALPSRRPVPEVILVDSGPNTRHHAYGPQTVIFQALANNAVVDEQIASRRGLASDRFELNRWQAVEESSAAAGDRRRYHEPEFVDNIGGEQCLRDRDTCVDADVASALLLEI